MPHICHDDFKTKFSYFSRDFKEIHARTGSESSESCKACTEVHQGSLKVGLKFDPSFQTSVDVIGFMDADWAGDSVERKSFQACIGTVSWGSKRQEIVALSSTQAEYVALSFAAQELMWLITFLKDLRHKQQSNVLNEDNQGAIALSKNLVNHSLRKHIDVKYHFIRDLVEMKRIGVNYYNHSMQKTEQVGVLEMTFHLSICMKYFTS